MGILIGRKRELQQLRRLQKTGRSEFLAVYGRRRVGKTYLIKEVFQNDFTFSHTGLAPVDETDAVARYPLKVPARTRRKNRNLMRNSGRNSFVRTNSAENP